MSFNICVNFIIAILNADQRDRSCIQSARTILCARHVKLFLDSTREATIYFYIQGLQIIAFYMAFSLTNIKFIFICFEKPN